MKEMWSEIDRNCTKTTIVYTIKKILNIALKKENIYRIEEVQFGFVMEKIYNLYEY